MDKLIYEENKKVTISNDGATIIKLLNIVHPAAKILIDIAKTQDHEVGDGTTTVVLLACEFLRMAKPFVQDGIHPRIIVNGYRKACNLVLDHLDDLKIDWSKRMKNDKRLMLEKCAQTALNSKLIANYKVFFSSMIVDAVQSLNGNLDLDMIGIAKIPGGSTTESQLIKGVAFKKTFSYAGFEQQPKKLKNPKIALLQHELELKSERENAEIRLNNPSQYQKLIDAEWKIIYEKLEIIVKSGAQIVLSELPIGDLATQYFADCNIFCAGRVPKDDIMRIAAATGAKLQTSISGLNSSSLGTCGNFEEKQIGNERYNFFLNCPITKTVTFIIRGGAEQYIQETERSLHDGIMIVKRCIQYQSIVPGGGATEMELSRKLRQHARKIRDKSQVILNAFAKAFEVIPRQLAINSGFDSTNLINELRYKHSKGNKYQGIDIDNEQTFDTFENFIWEPTLSKYSSISAACETACTILSIDETIRNPRLEDVPK